MRVYVNYCHSWFFDRFMGLGKLSTTNRDIGAKHWYVLWSCGLRGVCRPLFYFALFKVSNALRYDLFAAGLFYLAGWLFDYCEANFHLPAYLLTSAQTGHLFWMMFRWCMCAACYARLAFKFISCGIKFYGSLVQNCSLYFKGLKGSMLCTRITCTWYGLDAKCRTDLAGSFRVHLVWVLGVVTLCRMLPKRLLYGFVPEEVISWTLVPFSEGD